MSGGGTARARCVEHQLQHVKRSRNGSALKRGFRRHVSAKLCRLPPKAIADSSWRRLCMWRVATADAMSKSREVGLHLDGRWMAANIIAAARCGIARKGSVACKRHRRQRANLRRGQAPGQPGSILHQNNRSPSPGMRNGWLSLRHYALEPHALEPPGSVAACASSSWTRVARF